MPPLLTLTGVRILKIVNVKTAVVEGNFDWPLIQITTDEGICGYGEIRDAGSKWLALRLKPYLMGEDPMDVERLFRKIRRFGGRRRQGGGVSGVEMALWDIAGKVYRVPVYKLLGGRLRDKIPIYCDCHAGKPIASRADYRLDEDNYTPEAYAENVRRIKKLGFSLLKFDLGANVASLAPNGYVNGQVTHAGLSYQVRMVEALRHAAGEEVELALDCGQGTVDAAVRFGNAMEPYDLAWLEDLIGYGTVGEYREITRSVKTATLTGEDRYTREAFR
ncbi:MAG: mandelate racemase/muconate lactonizing enzyme family protein, partial [Candidatus Bathyarchaeota archaeon]|nr:mandelate racemase/muconate lactonizing enzyme family protein [Candidatus Bathyarchaeota archaeon]